MKGVVFTEFLDFVEETAGEDVLEAMIARADLPSGGAYTAVGKYDYREIVSMVAALAEISGAPAPQLVRSFGEHLFLRFAEMYPELFVARNNTLDFIEHVESHIHVEVRKLYPDAELPSLTPLRDGPDSMMLRYSSCRPFGELCIGLLRGCAQHFGETIEYSHTPTENGLIIQIRRVAKRAA